MGIKSQYTAMKYRQAMTDAMIHLNENRNLCNEMGLKGRKIAEEKFDLFKNTNLLINQLNPEPEKKIN